MVRTVNNSIKLYFVDYDGIFIPDFKGERAPELDTRITNIPKEMKDITTKS